MSHAAESGGRARKRLFSRTLGSEFDLVSAWSAARGTGPVALYESGDSLGDSYLVVGQTNDLQSSTIAPGLPPAGLRSIFPTAGPIEFIADAAVDSSAVALLGGLVGYVSYDACRSIEEIPDRHSNDLSIPEALFFRPSVVIRHDHRRRETIATCLDESADLLDRICQQPTTNASVPIVETPHPVDLDSIATIPDEATFAEAVRRAIAYIESGDVFQVNLSVRHDRPYAGKPEDLYRVLRRLNPSPYMVLFDDCRRSIVGASPEQLVRIEGRRVETRPIAGTRRRGRSEIEDRRKETDLLESEKERAEHLMLVDLERNDIGRIAEFGSVSVEELMVVERYSHVMHLVSSVVGLRREDADAIDVLEALFPGGTITGAPKIRAMEIIDELESHRRGIYTGSFGWIDSRGDGEFNIAIRSMVLQDGRVYAQAGAGIVSDSDPILEYRESLKKLASAITAIELSESTSPDSTGTDG